MLNIPVRLAELLGLPPEQVFKTTVTPFKVTVHMYAMSEGKIVIADHDAGREIVTYQRHFTRDGKEFDPHTHSILPDAVNEPTPDELVAAIRHSLRGTDLTGADWGHAHLVVKAVLDNFNVTPKG